MTGSEKYLEALLLDRSLGGLSEETGHEAIYRDVSRDNPRIAIALCRCGRSSGDPDLDPLVTRLRDHNSVFQVDVIDRICTIAGWDELKKSLKSSKANRA